MPKVSELIDYLQQLDGSDAEVVLLDEEFEGEGNYVSLAVALAQMDTAVEAGYAERPVESHRLVVLSTANLMPDTAQDLERAEFRAALPFIVAVYPEGFFVGCVGVSEGRAQLESDDLWQCRQWAHNRGYRYVLFDRDAEAEVPGLPNYSEDWA